MAEELVRIHDDFYILSTSARIDDRTRVLKHGCTFAVFDRVGDVEAFGPPELGLYQEDTRFLSRLVLRLQDRRPLLLSSTIRDDNATLAVDLMNPDLFCSGEVVVPRGTVHLFRSRFLWDGACYERIRVHNYSASIIELPLSVEFDADFRDIFEVRGAHRERRGHLLAPQIEDRTVTLAYRGLDERLRRTRIRFETAPDALTESSARYTMRLPRRGEVTYHWCIACVPDGPDGRSCVSVPPRYDRAAEQSVAALDRMRSEEPAVETSNEQFNHWLDRSLSDLHLMRSETPHGPYPFAGVPWYSTAFGRDGIITALECLWFNPAVARGVLRYLSATQADTENDEQDAQPGKILHETRAGEMAILGEVPFGHYYGSVDSTPLFVMLAAAYYDRCADLTFLESIWPHVERALDWIDRYGDVDGDGFVEYARHSPRGLVQQGWKDSHDSVFHADGLPAEPPIALCEVQAYVYAAKRGASRLAAALGRKEHGDRLEREAAELQRRFEDVFWCEDLSTYALALDGDKRPCCIRTSNAAHCLFAGIASRDRAGRVAETILGESSHSGWGIRTVASDQVGYNPMSYHNGSIWPHDNALAAAGLARYGLKDDALRVLCGFFDASLVFDLHRMPELFCGFPRRADQTPTLYPVSCSPQAWAAGAIFLMLQSCLGLDVCAVQQRLVFARPMMPEFLEEIRISGLVVGAASVDLLLRRHDEDVSVDVLRRQGELEVVSISS